MKEILAKFIEFLTGKSTFALAFELFCIMVFITWVAAAIVVVTNPTETKNIVEAVVAAYEKVNVKNALDLDTNITKELQYVMTDTASDRAHLDRYHDSKTDIQGDHFIYMSRSNETEEHGVTAAILENQKLPLALFGTVEPYEHGDCVVYFELKKTDVSYYPFLKEEGINSVIYCPIFSNTHQLIGTLGVDYVIQHPVPANKDVLVNKVKEEANRISAILSLAANKQ